MNYFVMLLIAGALAGLLGLTPAQQDPPCKCEVTVYKKKQKGSFACIVGIMRNSTTRKPLMVAPLVINGIILWPKNGGYSYSDVLPGDYKIIASAFTYYLCTQKVVAQEGDSIVCVFNMRRIQEGFENPGSFIHK